MIDTLRLNLVDCKIEESCPLSIQIGLLDYPTNKKYNENDLFIDNTGKIIRGSKAFLNDDKFNFTINPTVEADHLHKIKIKKFKRINEKIHPDIHDYNSDDEVKGIFLQTSLPRILNENNLKNLTFDEQKTALKELEKLLRKKGIKTNIFNAKLSRLDTFTNIKTDFIFYAYSNLLSLMECSRMKSIGWGDESFLWKNGNQQIAIYDKIREMMQKNNDWFLKERKKHLNVMRIENRLLKKRSIESNLKLITVDDLYKNYDEIKHYHKNTISNKIFKYDLDEIDKLTIDDLRTKFIISKKLYGKRWFNRYCFTLGVWTISKIADIEILSNIVDELDTDQKNIRMKKSRIKKAIEEAKFNFAPGGIFYDTKVNFKSNVDLYNELKTKFYKEVA